MIWLINGPHPQLILSVYLIWLINGPHPHLLVSPCPIASSQTTFPSCWEFAHSLKLLRTKERPWTICSDHSKQMSDCERIAQVTHEKLAIMSDLLRENERLWANRSGCPPKMSKCERFAQVAQHNRANEQIACFFWANRSTNSNKFVIFYRTPRARSDLLILAVSEQLVELFNRIEKCIIYNFHIKKDFAYFTVQFKKSFLFKITKQIYIYLFL